MMRNLQFYDRIKTSHLYHNIIINLLYQKYIYISFYKK
jgi:hypothetical protein